MYPSKLPIKLDDCFKHDHAELFIVEGDSAALAVNNRKPPTVSPIIEVLNLLAAVTHQYGYLDA